MLKTPKIDVCTLSGLFKNDKNLLNRWVAAVVDIVEDSAPGVLRECPYTVSFLAHTLRNHKILVFFLQDLIIKNRSVNSVSVPSLFPTGDYKAIFVAHIGNDYLGSLNVIFSVFSANRDTFG